MSRETQFNEELMCYVVGNRILSVRAVKLIVFASVCSSGSHGTYCAAIIIIMMFTTD